MNKTTLIVLAVIAALAIMIFPAWISSTNKEVSLRSEFTTQSQVCEANHDKMWKTISGIAQVSDRYRETFEKVYPDIIAGRYGDEKGGTLMKWITESNPVFDISLFSKLTNVIESQREGFYNEQKKLADIANQHRILLHSFPSNIFVGGREELKVTIVSSTKTKKAMETGIDDDADVFQK